MEVKIVAAGAVAVNFAPASEYEEIIQNLQTILSTPKFSVPLDRDFGAACDYVDKPVNKAMAENASAIFEAVRTYEPRVEVLAIDWMANSQGTLTAKVTVNIKDAET